MAADHPGWLLALVADVERYEFCHESVKGDPLDWRCLSQSLEAVPAEVREQAKGYAQAKREATDGT